MQLDRLIKDEFDATELDLRSNAGETISSHSTQQSGSLEEHAFESDGRDPSFTNDLFSAGELGVEVLRKIISRPFWPVL